MVYLGGVEGEFRLPYPRPEQAAVHQRRQRGHADLEHGPQPRRTTTPCATRSTSTAAATPTTSSSARRCGTCTSRERGYTLQRAPLEDRRAAHARRSSTSSCPTGASARPSSPGPPEMLEEMKDHWEAEGDPERLHLERFQPVIGGDGAGEAGEGGTVRFRVTEVEGECDGRTPILECGENAGAKLPFGCRMGICHTCVGQARRGPGPRPAHRRGPRRGGPDDPHLRERPRGARRDRALTTQTTERRR